MKLNRLSIITVIVLVLCSCEYKLDIPVSTISCNMPEENAASPYNALYQEILDEYVALGIPGLSVAIETPEHGWWIGCAGMARLEDQTPMTTCHVNHSASICKTYIATLTMRLVEDGLLGLDDPIRDYLPEDIVNGISNADVATVSQLLGHTSGIFQFDDDVKMFIEIFNNPLLYSSNKTLFEEYVYGKPPYAEAGEMYRYSNTNYSLLGMIIEDVLDMSLGDYFEQEIITPLGLENTFYKSSPGYPDEISNKVNSYFEEFPGQMQNCTDMQDMLSDIAMGHEGVIASPYEYARFIQELMRGNIVDQVTLDTMIARQTDKWEMFNYCLGMREWHVEDRLSYGHNGVSLGTMSTMMYFPDSDITLSAWINMGGIFSSDNTRNFDFPLIMDLVNVAHTGSRE